MAMATAMPTSTSPMAATTVGPSIVRAMFTALITITATVPRGTGRIQAMEPMAAVIDHSMVETALMEAIVLVAGAGMDTANDKSRMVTGAEYEPA